MAALFHIPTIQGAPFMGRPALSPRIINHAPRLVACSTDARELVASWSIGEDGRPARGWRLSRPSRAVELT